MKNKYPHLIPRVMAADFTSQKVYTWFHNYMYIMLGCHHMARPFIVHEMRHETLTDSVAALLANYCDFAIFC